jgi:ADP-ribose pyrophosphatase YjhB (NUDIX family)
MIREYPNRPIVGVGVVVLESTKVLMIRRAKNPRQGKWSLPGGAQELGETVYDAAQREVLEETGLSVKILGIVDVIDSIQKDDLGKIQYHYTLIDFVALNIGSSIPKAGSDASEVAWMTMEEISNLDLWSETIRIINLAIKQASEIEKNYF